MRLKLSLIVVGAIALIMACFGYGAASILARGAKDEFAKQLVATNRLILDLIASNQDSLRIAVGKLGDAFSARLAGEFRLDEKRLVPRNGIATPLLTLNGRVLNFSPDEVDEFTRRTGGNAATIFARQGEDFVRIATSLKKEDGSRAIGTRLGKSHPAYGELMAGRTYQGHAPLFGHHYMTQYQPIATADGRVIGVLFVGMDLRSNLESLKRHIAEFRIGASGYASIVDAEPGAGYRRFVLHPAKEGQPLVNDDDASEAARVLREALDRRHGIVRYEWMNPELGETEPREKIAAFGEYPELGWIVLATGYPDEAMDVANQGIKYMAAATLVVSLLLIAALNLGIGRFVLAPMLRLQERLRQSESSLRTVFDNMHDAAILHRRDGSVVDMNDQMLHLFGLDRETAMGLKLPADLATGDSAERFAEAWHLAAEGEPSTAIGTVRSPGGPGFSAEIHLSRCRIGGEDLIMVNISDITQRLEYERQLQYQAKFDALTGVANRSLLMDRIERALRSAARHKRLVGVAFIDLDQFKYINDALGHSVGDQLLRQVAERLSADIRGVDTVARQGGDEFVVVLSDFGDETDAYNILRRMHESLAMPYEVEGRVLHVTCSIGISLYPRDGADVDTLLRNADVAMYHVKESGRNGIRLFTAEMNEHLRDWLALEADLRIAVNHGQLLLHYQPQVSAARGRIVGVEALIRWQHPALGLVSPARFIPLAEETGLIVPIGAWVLREACHQAKQWQAAGFAGLAVAVNVSALQLRGGQLTSQVHAALRDSGLDPACLELEITESMLMADPEASIAVLNQLKTLGIAIALDDFGTGYSSLAYLKQLPIDTLKIDRAFVRDLPGDGDSQAIVATIIAMARNLKMRVVAEGVETDEQHQHLCGQGCHDLQGYLFARPMDGNELMSFLAGAQDEASGQPASAA
ncbi:MAG: diguanylate cyclase/phosphodiesterase with sensor [Rhodocyclaceae bacterium]|nr:diguanylate cyclase/phosphodiesterase with sensor [Rhodocyclaceae bacterium]